MLRLAARPDPRLVLALAAAATAALIAWYGVDDHIRFNDEILSVFGGRLLEAEGVGAIAGGDDLFSRGPERLSALLVWIANGLAPASTAAEFRVAHVVWAVVWAAAAVPVYATGRLLGLPAAWAAGAGVLVVLGPSAVYGVTLLNTAPGLLTLTTACCLGLRTALRPSWRVELALLAVAGLAVGARVGHAPFLLALAPVLLRATWRAAPGRAFPRALLRRHTVLSAAALVALAVLAVKGQSAVLGAYGREVTDQPLTLDQLWYRARVFGARIAQESALIPFALGVPWLLRELVRPRSDAGAALATLAVGGAAAGLFVFYNAPIEDRYLAIALPPVLLAAALAVQRREASWVATAAFAAATVFVIDQVGLERDDTPFQFFVAPATSWLDRSLGSRLGDTVVVLLVLATAAALIAWRMRDRRLLAAAAAGLVLFQAAGAVYAMDKFTALAARPDVTWDQLTFVDRAAGDEPVHFLTENRRLDPTVVEQFFDLAHFNRAPSRSAIELGAPLPFTCCPPGRAASILFTYDKVSGAVSGADELAPLVVVAPDAAPYALRTDPVAAGVDGFRLERRAPGPVRLELVQLGARRWRVFEAAPGDCLLANRIAADGSSETLRLPVRPGRSDVDVPGGARLADARVVPC